MGGIMLLPEAARGEERSSSAGRSAKAELIASREAQPIRR
jgi:hypothetical protein